MRTAKEILENYSECFAEFVGVAYAKSKVTRAINQARKETILECADKCSGASMMSENEIKEKILSLINELK